MAQQILGFAAALLSVFGMVPYTLNVLRKKTRPHLFTWIIWTLMTLIAFVAQVSGGGGPGAWATGITVLFCLPILGAAIFVGEHDIRPLDWFSLVLAAVAGLAWIVNNDPTISVILISFIDAVAFVPTIRKSIHKPEEETLLNYALNALKHTLSIAALSKISIVTALYPAVVGVMNGVMIVVLAVRRSQLRSRTPLSATARSTATSTVPSIADVAQ